MANNINIDLNNPNGVTLATENKFCDKNIYVAPLLQSKTITNNGDVIADTGYVGLSKVAVNIPPYASSGEKLRLKGKGVKGGARKQKGSRFYCSKIRRRGCKHG